MILNIIVENLQDLSLRSISVNLYLNYRICYKNSWKIPKAIGDKIFNYCSKHKHLFHIDDFYLFYKIITSLERVKINKKHIVSAYILHNLDTNGIKEINLSNIILDNCEKLGEFLLKCTQIESINLKDCKFKSNQSIRIFNGLIPSAQHHLKSINLSNCNLNKREGECLKFLFFRCSKLEEINMEGNSHISYLFKEFFSKLSEKCSKSLRNINLSWCHLEENAMIEFNEVLDKFFAIESRSDLGKSYLST